VIGRAPVALNDEEPLIRGHAAWALGRIGTEAARQALRGREEGEEDAWVREEIAAALGEVLVTRSPGRA
jgi:epoxyqueuosine reductase